MLHKLFILYRIELTLSKQSSDMWSGVVIGNNKGQMTLDPAVVEEIHERLAGLTSYEVVSIIYLQIYFAAV